MRPRSRRTQCQAPPSEEHSNRFAGHSEVSFRFPRLSHFGLGVSGTQRRRRLSLAIASDEDRGAFWKPD